MSIPNEPNSEVSNNERQDASSDNNKTSQNFENNSATQSPDNVMKLEKGPSIPSQICLPTQESNLEAQVSALNTTQSSPSISYQTESIPTRNLFCEDRAGSDPTTDNRLLGIESIKTYYPTEQEFKDPYTYIAALEVAEKSFGAVKIVPPPSWNHQPTIDVQKFKFRAVKQSLKKSSSNYHEKIDFYRDLLNYHSSKSTPLQRLPSIDKKVLDLYSLRNSVREKGGFDMVCQKKLWAQIGRELGYTGRIMTSLSSSLKIAYTKILSGFEESVGKPEALESVVTHATDINEENKRQLHDKEGSNNLIIKKQKRSSDISLITNSKLVFRRQKDILKNKGFKTDFESYTEERPGVTSSDQNSFPYYDFYFWHGGLEVYDPPYSKADITRDYDFKQFYDIHLKNSKLSVDYDDTAMISDFWNILSEKSDFNVETAFDLPSTIFGSGFPSFDRVESDAPPERFIDPWNLNNFALSDKGLLRYLPDNNDSLVRSKLDVSMLHSVSSWGIEDQFLSLIDYLHIGSPKVWYFIDPQDQTKYEDLLKSRVEEHQSLVPENALDGFAESITNDIIEGIRQSDILKKRENSKNPKFDRFYEHEMGGVKLNSNYLISPDTLKEFGIRVHYVSQRPGEFVIKFPRTYSATVSLGVSLSEKVNFATINWLDHAFDSGLWLESQKLLPNFSVFRLLTSILEENKDSTLLKKVEPLFKSFVEKEIVLRSNLKSVVRNVTVIQNKFDFIADDTLRECFPTKVVVYDGDEHFILDPYTFYAYWSDKIKDLRIELHIFHSDEKLKAFQRTINTLAQDPSDWLEKYNNLLKSRAKPSFASLKQIQHEGQRLPFDIPEVRYLKEYLNYAGDWIEKVQELLSCKQKNRTRNRNKSSTEVEEKVIDRKVFEEILDSFDALTFTCPEIDQMTELCSEINQYEVSVRHFLDEQGNSVEEFNEMISLGKSFGIKLKSIEFLERVLAKILWRQRVTETLDSSMNLNDFIELLDQGYEVGGEKDGGVITILKQKIKNGKFLGARIKYELSKPKFTINEIDELFIKVKDAPVDPDIIEDLETLKKNHLLTSEKRTELYKVMTANSVDLLILRSQRQNKDIHDPIFDEQLYQRLLTKFSGGENDPRPRYSNAKDIMDASRGVLPISQSSHMDIHLKQVEEWLRRAKKLFGKPNAPFSVLRNHLETLLDKAVYPFNIQDAYVPVLDAHTEVDQSTNFRLEKSNEEPSVDEKSKLFCICRHRESGVMIECEGCFEWYHCKCMKIGRGRAKRPDDYICPICDYRVTIPREYNSPKIEDLAKVVDDAAFFELKPDELEIIRSIYEEAQRFREFLKIELIWNDGQINETDVDKVKFYLRKLEGSSVLLLDEYNQLRLLVWKLRPVCDIEPPVISETISKTKRVRKKEVSREGTASDLIESVTPVKLENFAPSPSGDKATNDLSTQKIIN